MQTFCRAWSSRSTIPQLHIVGPVLTAGMVVDACAVFFSFLFLYVLLLPPLLPRVPSSGFGRLGRLGSGLGSRARVVQRPGPHEFVPNSSVGMILTTKIRDPDLFAILGSRWWDPDLLVNDPDPDLYLDPN